jgi:hypothetical protein
VNKQTIETEEDVCRLISSDVWMMNILLAVRTLNLPDWWISAGFVRLKVWDAVHGYQERTPLPDVDVIYFDESNDDEAEEKRIENRLLHLQSDVPWSVKRHCFRGLMYLW